MSLRNTIKRILNEESDKDYTSLIERILTDLFVPDHKDEVCGVKVVHPREKMQLHRPEQYSVIFYFNGLEFRFLPKSNLKDELMNEAWDLVYNYTGQKISMWSNYVTSCDEVDLQENINRVVMNENRVVNMVKELGLYDAIRYFGGYENLKTMIGDNDIKSVISNSVTSRKDKIELVKQLVKEINESMGNSPEEGFWFLDLEKDPLNVDPSFVYDNEITLIQIELFYLNGVVMYYYGGENNSREISNTEEEYDYLPESILDDIIEYLL
jgi:hypothetical protein